jgi:hypothetical protein
VLQLGFRIVVASALAALALIGVSRTGTSGAFGSQGSEGGTPDPHFSATRPVLSVDTHDPFALIGSADFNGDGLADVVVVRYPADYRPGTSAPISILLNNGRGGLVDATKAMFTGHVPETEHPRELVIADFNGDRRPDIFIADHGYDHPPYPGFQDTLVLSTADGKLVDATANLPQRSDYSHSATVADVDGNGTVDLFVGNTGSGDYSPPELLLNDGSGHFRICPNCLPAPVLDIHRGNYTDSQFVDVNGDGHPDLILGSSEFGSIPSEVLLNDGSGHFRILPGALPAKPFGPSSITTDIQAADLNNDAHPDLVISYAGPNPPYFGRSLQVLINNGDGTFRDETAARLPQQPTASNDGNWIRFLSLEDINHDGSVDIATQTDVWPDSNRDETQPVYLNDGSGHFSPIPASAVPRMQPGLYLFMDIDGDGGNDLLTAVPATPGTVEQFFIARDLTASISTLYATVPAKGPVVLTTPTVATTVARGRYHIVVNDRSTHAGFRFQGKGINKTTSAAFVGRTVWPVTLTPGTYRYWSDQQPHRVRTIIVH